MTEEIKQCESGLCQPELTDKQLSDAIETLKTENVIIEGNAIIEESLLESINTKTTPNSEKMLGGITGKGFVPGVSGNPEGRPPETPEQKIVKRAIKELVKEYKEDLAQVLPQIRPILIAKAVEGDMVAIKEIHDRVMDKSKQPTDITSDGEKISNQVLVKFIDGKPIETNDNRDTPGIQAPV